MSQIEDREKGSGQTGMKKVSRTTDAVLMAPDEPWNVGREAKEMSDDNPFSSRIDHIELFFPHKLNNKIKQLNTTNSGWRRLELHYSSIS